MKKHLLPLLFLFVIIVSLCKAQNPILYGATNAGGKGGEYGKGIIFNYNTLRDTETIIYNFPRNDTDGIFPTGSLIQANNGLLYGMTNYGGIYDSTFDGDGIIFS